MLYLLMKYLGSLDIMHTETNDKYEKMRRMFLSIRLIKDIII